MGLQGVPAGRERRSSDRPASPVSMQRLAGVSEECEVVCVEGGPLGRPGKAGGAVESIWGAPIIPGPPGSPGMRIGSQEVEGPGWVGRLT